MSDSQPGGVTRRNFFQLVGAATALGACTDRPDRRILPYTRQPADVVPGAPSHYATSWVEHGHGIGLVVECQAGRPIKAEGNPEHPASLGAAGVAEQASVLGLYDPDRARTLLHRGEPASAARLAETIARVREHGGEGTHFVCEATSSPLMGRLLAQLRAALPAARVWFHAAFPHTSALAAARTAFGQPAQVQLELERAGVIVALGADFLSDGPFQLRYQRRFADGRRVTSVDAVMNRLYVVEAEHSLTGASADHRLRVKPSQIEAVAGALLAAVGVRELPAALVGRLGEVPPELARWAQIVARDLQRVRGHGAVLVGSGGSPRLHLIGHALNAALGNVGPAAPIWLSAPTLLEAGQPSHDLAGLAAELASGRARTLVVLGGNPVYASPAALGLGAGFAAVPESIYLGLYEDETARVCRWFVPAAHLYEAWGDVRAWDGTLGLIQPMIAPLHDGRTPSELLGQFLGDPTPSGHDQLRAAWSGDEAGWLRALGDGVVDGTRSARLELPVRWDALSAPLGVAPAAAAGVELVIRPHPAVGDGRYTNNPWLLELPEPTTKLTWDNAAELSPGMAARLGVDTGDVVELGAAGRHLRVPAVVVPGMADDTVLLHAGFGRQGRSETRARGVGVDAFVLAGDGPFVPVTVTRTGQHQTLAITQRHFELEGRPIALAATLAELRARPDLTAPERAPQPSLFPIWPSGVPRSQTQWGMSLDLNVCTGCSACVMACVAENNTPVVGKTQVEHSREMHWLRIDRYLSGPDDDPAVISQPMMCQHCEQAPCEYVCPTAATAHSADGLNEMTYNRCVGTRFCSNNCPYKVRRFNWFDWGAREGTLALGMNPNVTVRDRGVMEKCTYCVQRIRSREIEAKVAGWPLRDGDVVTACAQACPSRALVFGMVSDPKSEVSRLGQAPQRFHVLDELGTRPRNTYLARLYNKNPELA